MQKPQQASSAFVTEWKGSFRISFNDIQLPASYLLGSRTVYLKRGWCIAAAMPGSDWLLAVPESDDNDCPSRHSHAGGRGNDPPFRPRAGKNAAGRGRRGIWDGVHCLER